MQLLHIKELVVKPENERDESKDVCDEAKHDNLINEIEFSLSECIQRQECIVLVSASIAPRYISLAWYGRSHTQNFMTILATVNKRTNILVSKFTHQV